MKLPHPKKAFLKPLFVATTIIVLVLIGWLYYAHHYQKWPFQPHASVTQPENTVNYSKPSDAQTSGGNSIKQQVANQVKNSQSSSGTTNPTANPAPKVTIDITSANKTASFLVVRALIQKITSAGSCVLTMQGPNGASYTSTVGVQALASASTCQGFNIPLSSLSSGQWSMTITFSDGIDTATVTQGLSL